jgi:hypothetical protein
MDNIKENFFKFKTTDELKIRGVTVILEEGTIDHTKLLLWPGNPRITHKAELHNEILEQDEIEDALEATGSIKELKKKIEEDLKINEPLLVDEASWEVMEGNRRLFVNRMLYAQELKKGTHENNPWQFIKVKLIPIGTDPKLIFSYLGTLHLDGKKEWDSYGKAAFLAKEQADFDYTFHELAEAHKWSLQEVKKSVLTYNFMKSRKHLNEKNYSVFELLETVSVFKNERAKDPNFDNFYYNQVVNGGFPTAATDVRRFLPEIINSKNKKLKKDFYNGNISFEDAREIVHEERTDRPQLKKISEFHKLLANPQTESELEKVPHGAARGNVIQDLNKIIKLSKKIISAIEKHS